MRWTYDPTVDILCVRLSDEKVLESEEVQAGLVVDYNHKGRIVGFEIFDARERVAPSTMTAAHAAE